MEELGDGRKKGLEEQVDGRKRGGRKKGMGGTGGCEEVEGWEEVRMGGTGGWEEEGVGGRRGWEEQVDMRKCINGSTLLHTAAYFGLAQQVGQLLALGVDVNLRDYKGATPLHRAKDVECLKLLLNAGALPSALDTGHNTPLHVKCYGETDQCSDTAAVDVLLKAGAKIVLRNSRSLMPIHCAAMQGRTDLISLLLKSDSEGAIRRALAEESSKAPPSVVYLAVSSEGLLCAEWLVQHDFEFKFGEEDQLLQKIVAEQITMGDRVGAVMFLLGQGADINKEHQGGNTILHYAACMSGLTDILELLIESGAALNHKNMDGSSPLFIACQANNKFASSVLIDQGANVRTKNIHGMTALDFVVDYDEWIECGYFNEEIRARLKAYSLKHARDLVRAITKKVKHPSHYIMNVPALSSGNSQNNQIQWHLPGQRATSAKAGGFPAFRKTPMKRQLGYVKAV
ncbi:hypothetical protein LSAT2_006969 [Lamellibrachia satsuma]|nr:hypothetical protein LSAT2_006969 [Lamellibrachia satsuma]